MEGLCAGDLFLSSGRFKEAIEREIDGDFGPVGRVAWTEESAENQHHLQRVMEQEDRGRRSWRSGHRGLRRDRDRRLLLARRCHRTDSTRLTDPRGRPPESRPARRGLTRPTRPWPKSWSPCDCTWGSASLQSPACQLEG